MNLLTGSGLEEDWLTEKQKKVLKLREKGYTQSEIARKTDTTRSNICVIEKNARRNIEKSKNTLEIAKLLKYPVRFEIDREVDIYDIPRIIFRKADDKNIKINISGPELLRKVREKANLAFEDNKLIGKVEVGISRDGSLAINGVRKAR